MSAVPQMWQCIRCNKEFTGNYNKVMSADICEHCRKEYKIIRDAYFEQFPKSEYKDFVFKYRDEFPNQKDQVFFVPYTTALRHVKKRVDATVTLISRMTTPGTMIYDIRYDAIIWESLAPGFAQPFPRVIRTKHAAPYIKDPVHIDKPFFEIWKLNRELDYLSKMLVQKLIESFDVFVFRPENKLEFDVLAFRYGTHEALIR